MQTYDKRFDFYRVYDRSFYFDGFSESLRVPVRLWLNFQKVQGLGMAEQSTSGERGAVPRQKPRLHIALFSFEDLFPKGALFVGKRVILHLHCLG